MLERFVEALEANDKGKAVMMCLEALEKKEITIPVLYEKVLAPALNRLEAPEEEIEDLIWREHAMSAIVRSIIEASYPYVLREREQKNAIIAKKVLIFCPAREEHELGARMIADFFLIQGYNVTYIGANTPEGTIKKALARLQPDYLCVSVSNPYNLFTAKKLIKDLREYHDQPFKVMAGGSAFARGTASAGEVGADMLLQTFADIENLRRGEEVPQ